MSKGQRRKAVVAGKSEIKKCKQNKQNKTSILPPSIHPSSFNQPSWINYVQLRVLWTLNGKLEPLEMSLPHSTSSVCNKKTRRNVCTSPCIDPTALSNPNRPS